MYLNVNPTPKPRQTRADNTQETKDRIGKMSRKRWRDMTEGQITAMLDKSAKTRAKNGTKPRPRPETTWKAGWREFGGKRNYYRSRWEANYGRVLEWLKQRGDIKEWEHEPDTFWFEGIRRGCRSYLPDFKVTQNNGSIEYHEVKGWMDKRSKTKIKRMAKYHPDVTLIVIDSKNYKAIARNMSRLVPDWETKDSPVDDIPW